MIDESVRSLVDELSATQMRVAQLERELLDAKLALADRETNRAKPVPAKPATKGYNDTRDDGLDNYTGKLFQMQDELSTMIQATSDAIIVSQDNETK